MAALTAVPLSSGRGGVARRWGAWGGDVTGPTREPMTPARRRPRRGGKVQGKNLGRVGTLGREHATSGSVKTLWCTHGPDSRGSGSWAKHGSGTGDDDHSADPAGKTLGRMKIQEGNDLCPHSKPVVQRHGFPQGPRP
jgi:hypothetical protein